jgi:phospholipid N-methyltransferase
MVNKPINQMGTIEFFKESLRNLKTVGTLTRSSRFLCKGMIKHIDFDKAKVIVELGAGDGVITKHILKNMHKDCLLMIFEVNDNFTTKLNDIKDNRLIVIQDSAEKLEYHLDFNGLNEIDYVISAIPFVILPDDIANKIIMTCKKRMMQDGLYVQVHYSLMAKKLYEKVFGNVDINFVPLNIPPAFVLVSQNT